jgi:AcrR family transcriptional regulator
MAFSTEAARPDAVRSDPRADVRVGVGAGVRTDVAATTRFVAAARELAAETGSSAFTVQQVVERAGGSLKSFYRRFDGKDDLLLALLEEDSAMGAALLAGMIARRRAARMRVRAWLTGLFRLMAAGDVGYVGVLVREHRRLAEARPERTERALAPFIDLLADELATAMDQGVVRAGDARRDAATVFDLVLLKIHDMAMGRADLDPEKMADYVWAFCWSGLAGDAGERRP